MVKIAMLSVVYLCCWVGAVMAGLVGLMSRRRRRPCPTCPPR